MGTRKRIKPSCLPARSLSKNECEAHSPNVCSFGPVSVLTIDTFQRRREGREEKLKLRS